MRVTTIHEVSKSLEVNLGGRTAFHVADFDSVPKHHELVALRKYLIKLEPKFWEGYPDIDLEPEAFLRVFISALRQTCWIALPVELGDEPDRGNLHDFLSTLEFLLAD